MASRSPELVEQAVRPFGLAHQDDATKKAADLPNDESACVKALEQSAYSRTWTQLEQMKVFAKIRRSRSHAQFAKAMLGSLRAFLDMLVRDDGTMAVAEIASTLSGAVNDYCAARKQLHGSSGACPVPVKSESIERAFEIVGALVSYGTSYRASTSAEGEDSAKLAEFRAEQRKQAMAALIDVLTDRSNRSGDWVTSFGASVGLARSWIDMRAPDDTSENAGGSTENELPLRLDTGLSIQYLPDGLSPGAHFQLSFLDLAQYAALRAGEGSDDIENADADVRTALIFGASGGILFGNPSLPFLFSAFVGYAPWLRFDAEQGRGAYVTAFSVGIYVPFIDFN